MSETPVSDHYSGEADYVQRLSQRWPRSIVVPLAQAIRYVSRAGIKTVDPTPDLIKARWWIDRALRIWRDGDGDGATGE